MLARQNRHIDPEGRRIQDPRSASQAGGREGVSHRPADRFFIICRKSDKTGACTAKSYTDSSGLVCCVVRVERPRNDLHSIWLVNPIAHRHAQVIEFARGHGVEQ